MTTNLMDYVMPVDTTPLPQPELPSKGFFPENLAIPTIFTTGGTIIATAIAAYKHRRSSASPPPQPASTARERSGELPSLQEAEAREGSLLTFLVACVTSQERCIAYFRHRAIENATDMFTFAMAGTALYIAPRMFPSMFMRVYTTSPTIEALFSSKRTFAAALLSVAGLKTIIGGYLNLVHAHKKLIPRATSAADPPFIGEHVIVDMEKHTFSPAKVTIYDFMDRGVAHYGMHFATFLYCEATMGVEYHLNAIYRSCCHYAGKGRYSRVTTTAEEFYLAMINTSMICWMNSETGHLEYPNLRLPFNKTDTRLIEMVKIELDHDAKRFVRMYMDGVEVIGTEEAALIATYISALYAHPHVHWWANATNQLIGEWSLAQEASDVTQWINNAAVFKSWWLLGTTCEAMIGILFHNATQGLPLHGSDQEKHVAEYSVTHKIVRESRLALREAYPDWGYQKIDAVMAATVFHSSDHYYTDKYMAFASQSRTLHYDFSLIRLALASPNVYHTRQLLCRERLDDPIAKLMYEIAKKHDAHFADHGLFFCCAN